MQTRSRLFSLALRGIFGLVGLTAPLLAGPGLLAQASLSPNANGANSTFTPDGDVQTRPPTPLGSAQLTAIPDDFTSLRLASGVLLNVNVYDAPEFTTQVRVDEQGNINIPVLGDLHVAGETVAEAQKAIVARFRTAQILTNPQVTLNVLQYAGANVAVLGEVQTPGRFQMLAPHKLIDVLGMAGGETNLAGETIEVEGPSSSDPGNAGGPGKEAGSPVIRTYHYVRGTDTHPLESAMVSPGDTVRVPRAGVVYVLGAVFRPGGYVMQEYGALNVAQAVSLAQGTLMQAKIGSIRVVRHQPDGTLKEIPIDYKAIMDGKQTPLQLEAQDIVYVPVSKIKSVFTAGGSIVGQAGAATIFAAK